MQHCRERVRHRIKAALWLEPFDLALHQILQGRCSRGLLCLRETFHSLLGISLAVCPQEMSWQEHKLGNDELSPGGTQDEAFPCKTTNWVINKRDPHWAAQRPL